MVALGLAPDLFPAGMVAGTPQPSREIEFQESVLCRAKSFHAGKRRVKRGLQPIGSVIHPDDRGFDRVLLQRTDNIIQLDLLAGGDGHK